MPAAQFAKGGSAFLCGLAHSIDCAAVMQYDSATAVEADADAEDVDGGRFDATACGFEAAAVESLVPIGCGVSFRHDAQRSAAARIAFHFSIIGAVASHMERWMSIFRCRLCDARVRIDGRTSALESFLFALNQRNHWNVDGNLIRFTRDWI